MTLEAPLIEVETLNEPQIVQLWELSRREWWSANRSLEETRRIVAGTTLNFGVLDKADEKLVGYSRVISDGISKALILDVIVADTHRGLRLGERLMERILTHKALCDVQHFELYCLPALIPFYERWGFTAALGEMRFMRLTVKNQDSRRGPCPTT